MDTKNKYLKSAINNLGIDVPVIDAKIKGNTLVLYLYGGEIRECPLAVASNSIKSPLSQVDSYRLCATPLARSQPGNLPESKPDLVNLGGMRRDELRKYAAKLGIKVHGKSKAELIKMIMELEG